MRGQQLINRLREEVLVGDGALGTMMSERGLDQNTCYEHLNLTHPEWIKELHETYLEAGAQVLETNTFAANRTRLLLPDGCEVAAVNEAGASLAREVAGDRAYVAGSIGPLALRVDQHESDPLSDDQIRDIFREQIVALANGGVDVLLLETFIDLTQILLALEVARQETDLPVICQLAFHEKGHTYGGIHVLTALEALQEAGADVIGANCGRGVRCVMNAVEMMTSRTDCLISAYPNAGLPAYVDGRYLFGAPLPYLIDSADRMLHMGVNLVGGCCGTTPDYIRRLADLVGHRKPAPRSRVHVTEVPASVQPAIPTEAAEATRPSPIPSGSILEGIEGAPARRRPLIVVELDPPKNLCYEPIVRRAQQLKDMGVDAITMADNPVATMHMGNMALAQIVQREADIPVIVHLTCRDHNLLGLQSLLLAAHVMGLHHMLALTGDPARVGDTPGAKSVYDLSSFGLIELISKFNNGVNNAGMPLKGQTRFTVGVAFNPNGRNLPGQISRLRRKQACGAHFAMTQPIYDPERFDQMCAATSDLTMPILVGVMPLLSERNAEYLHNEVPGILLTEEARCRMKGLKGPEGRKMGLRICAELIDHMVHRADGFYIIPSQIRTEMAVDLISHLHQHLPRTQ